MKNTCIACGDKLDNTDFYCSFACAQTDLRESMSAFKKTYGQMLTDEVFNGLDDEGNVVAEDYAYGDVAAENCSHL